jgi:hypothetical protein
MAAAWPRRGRPRRLDHQQLINIDQFVAVGGGTTEPADRTTRTSREGRLPASAAGATNAMRYTADTGYPFDTDNRAWQRLLAVSGEHFDTVTWSRQDGRPVMLTLYDLATGDGFTVAVLDSLEVRDCWATLKITMGAAFTMPTKISANRGAGSVRCRPSSARRRERQVVGINNGPRALRVAVHEGGANCGSPSPGADISDGCRVTLRRS